MATGLGTTGSMLSTTLLDHAEWTIHLTMTLCPWPVQALGMSMDKCGNSQYCCLKKAGCACASLGGSGAFSFSILLRPWLLAPRRFDRARRGSSTAGSAGRKGALSGLRALRATKMKEPIHYWNRCRGRSK